MFRVDELLEATQGKLIQGKRDIKVRDISIDSRTIRRGEAFIAIKGNNFDGHNFMGEAIRKGAKAIVIQNSIPPFIKRAGQNSKNIPVIAVKETTKALGDIARFRRKKFNIPVIAVTGSNGKTTVKEMIAWILSKKFCVLKNEGTKNNQIGLSLTLLNLKSHHDIAVLEIGTNHPGEIEYLTNLCLPNIGIITNIGTSHLEYLCSLKGVLKEKYALIKNLKEPYIAILNADDSLLKDKLARRPKRAFAKASARRFVLAFGVKNRCDFFARGIKSNPQVYRWTFPKLEFKVNKKYKFTLKTLGYYNIYNALAAIAVARIFGMDYKDISYRLATFDFPKARFIFTELNNIRFIDDTYNSNPVSLKEALDVLEGLKTKGRKILVMGDMLELGSHSKLFHCQIGRNILGVCDVFVGVGKLSKLAADAAKAAGFDNENIFTCETSYQARDTLFKMISFKKDDIVLVKGSRLMRMEEILS